MCRTRFYCMYQSPIRRLYRPRRRACADARADDHADAPRRTHRRPRRRPIRRSYRPRRRACADARADDHADAPPDARTDDRAEAQFDARIDRADELVSSVWASGV